MTSGNLENRCKRDYGLKIGKRVFRAMMGVANKDFCVATGWNSEQVSISRSCKYRGRIFRFNNDYSCLIAEDGRIIDIKTAKYSDILGYLSSSRMEQRHCEIDD